MLLIGVCICCSRLSAFICCLQRNNRSNFLCYYVFIIVILWQIIVSWFSGSQNAQPCWSIRVLLQLITRVRVLQVAPFQHRSSKKWTATVNTGMWDLIRQLLSYFARKQFSWLWPAAVLINSRGILIVAGAIFLRVKSPFILNWLPAMLFLPSYWHKIRGQLTVKCKGSHFLVKNDHNKSMAF